MNEAPPSDPNDFQQELEILRSILRDNLHRAKEDPLLGTQLEFWLESAKFLELDIEIWARRGMLTKKIKPERECAKCLLFCNNLLIR
jgi:hypothetical protein